MRFAPSVLFFFIFFSCLNLCAQTPGTTPNKQLQIVRADRLNFQQLDSATQLQSLAGGVIVRQENTLFSCDSAVLNMKQNFLEAFGRVHINDADSVHTYSDYLRYNGNEKKAYLNKNVRLTDGKGTLTTQELIYDVNTKIGTYVNGGRVVNGKTVLTSVEGLYYGETRDIYFKKNVKLRDPEYTIDADSLMYNTYDDKATFISRTVITSGKRKIITREGYYDLKNRTSYFGKRPTIADSTSLLIADEVAFDERTNFGEARGNVIFKDTAQGITSISNNLKINRNTSSLLATVNPVMIIKQDKDSIFIAADTLLSGRLTDLLKTRSISPLDTVSNFTDTITLKKDSSKNRYFEAYSNVRIFSDSLQAVADSLIYTGVDSIFRLFKNPVLWSNDNQITGDTLYLFTKNKKPSQMRVFENAMAISKVSGEYYNQVKGRTITGFFVNGDVSSFRSKGAAELVYYTTDEENKYIGVNKSNADVVNVSFDKKKPNRVSFIKDVEGTLYPMKQVNHTDLRLKGFKILDDRRPKTKFDLFGK
jgi:lipopolysaccharide export system protein LptA